MKSTLCESLGSGLERKNSPQTVGAEQRHYVRDPTFEAKHNRVSRHTDCACNKAEAEEKEASSNL